MNKERENKTCQNCGHFVDKRFCPRCGQENRETRQPFYHLFAHFFSDFIHYDNQFWRTIVDLYRPAKLSKAYLSGKRKSYVSPFKLYIFISFLAFFIPSVLPDMNKTQDIDKSQDYKANSKIVNTDSGNADDESEGESESEKGRNRPEIVNKIYQKLNTITSEKLHENFIHHSPKAIFLYMPIFAFWLWIFHNKKKRLYFDHGIYTLHYFSFVLLTILLYAIINWLLSVFQWNMPDWIIFAMLCYFIYYFFHSHRIMYQETKALSRTKCVLLFFINTFCMFLFISLYFVLIVLFFS